MTLTDWQTDILLQRAEETRKKNAQQQAKQNQVVPDFIREQITAKQLAAGMRFLTPAAANEFEKQMKAMFEAQAKQRQAELLKAEQERLRQQQEQQRLKEIEQEKQRKQQQIQQQKLKSQQQQIKQAQTITARKSFVPTQPNPYQKFIQSSQDYQKQQQAIQRETALSQTPESQELRYQTLASPQGRLNFQVQQFNAKIQSEQIQAESKANELRNRVESFNERASQVSSPEEYAALQSEQQAIQREIQLFEFQQRLREKENLIKSRELERKQQEINKPPLKQRVEQKLMQDMEVYPIAKTDVKALATDLTGKPLKKAKTPKNVVEAAFGVGELGFESVGMFGESLTAAFVSPLPERIRLAKFKEGEFGIETKKVPLAGRFTAETLFAFTPFGETSLLLQAPAKPVLALPILLGAGFSGVGAGFSSVSSKLASGVVGRSLVKGTGIAGGALLGAGFVVPTVLELRGVSGKPKLFKEKTTQFASELAGFGIGSKAFSKLFTPKITPLGEPKTLVEIKPSEKGFKAESISVQEAIQSNILGTKKTGFVAKAEILGVQPEETTISFSKGNFKSSKKLLPEELALTETKINLLNQKTTESSLGLPKETKFFLEEQKPVFKTQKELNNLPSVEGFESQILTVGKVSLNKIKPTKFNESFGLTEKKFESPFEEYIRQQKNLVPFNEPKTFINLTQTKTTQRFPVRFGVAPETRIMELGLRKGIVLSETGLKGFSEKYAFVPTKQGFRVISLIEGESKAKPFLIISEEKDLTKIKGFNDLNPLRPFKKRLPEDLGTWLTGKEVKTKNLTGETFFLPELSATKEKELFFRTAPDLSGFVVPKDLDIKISLGIKARQLSEKALQDLFKETKSGFKTKTVSLLKSKTEQETKNSLSDVSSGLVSNKTKSSVFSVQIQKPLSGVSAKSVSKSLVEPKLKPVSIRDAMKKQFSGLKPSQTPFFVVNQKSSSIQNALVNDKQVLSNSLTKSGVEVGSKVKQKDLVGFNVSYKILPEQIAERKTVFGLLARFDAGRLLKTPTEIVPRTIQPVNIKFPELPNKPFIPFLPDQETFKPKNFFGGLTEQAFAAFVKTKQGFKQVSGGLTYAGALQKGILETDIYGAKRTFKVEAIEGTPTKTRRLFDIESVLKERFRKPIRKGVQQFNRPEFIEKTRYAISSKQEKQQITEKGLQALKNNFSFSRKKKPFGGLLKLK